MVRVRTTFAESEVWGVECRVYGSGVGVKGLGFGSWG